MILHRVIQVGRMLVPRLVRARLRQSDWLRRRLKSRLSGPLRLDVPGTDLCIFVDGYKHASLVSSGMANFEVKERRSLARLVNGQVRTVWDVGANIGFFVISAVQTLGREIDIHCFEPDVDNLALLKQTLAANNLRATVVEAAVSSSVGTMQFNRDLESGSTGSLEAKDHFVKTHYGIDPTPVTVPVLTLDSEIANGRPEPDLIKIDVEGHELSVLRGATELLKRRKPLLQIECTRYEEELSQFLHDHGYKLYAEDLTPIDRVTFNTFAVPADRVPAST